MNADDVLLLEDGLMRLLNTITMMCEPDCDWDYIKNETTIAARDIRLVLDKSEREQVTQLLDDGDVFDTSLDMESE